MTKISVRNISTQMRPVSHGDHLKDMFVCHETITPDALGWGDIDGVLRGLRGEGYGIQGMTDLEGHKAWTLSNSDWVLYHAGGVNSRAVGVENVSIIPLLIQRHNLTNEQAHERWLSRVKQLDALAMLMCGWHNADKQQHPLIRSNGDSRGVCSHWDVSQHHKESLGHWDCRPYDKGGHFPLAHVIAKARLLADAGYKF